MLTTGINKKCGIEGFMRQYSTCNCGLINNRHHAVIDKNINYNYFCNLHPTEKSELIITDNISRYILKCTKFVTYKPTLYNTYTFTVYALHICI